MWFAIKRYDGDDVITEIQNRRACEVKKKVSSSSPSPTAAATGTEQGQDADEKCSQLEIEQIPQGDELEESEDEQEKIIDQYENILRSKDREIVLLQRVCVIMQ